MGYGLTERLENVCSPLFNQIFMYFHMLELSIVMFQVQSFKLSNKHFPTAKLWLLI